MPTTTNDLTTSLLLGAATGLRSTAGVLTVALSGPPVRGAQPLAALSSRWGRRLIVLNTVAEAGIDKAPFAPPRTATGPLGGKLAFAVLAASAGAQRTGRNPVAAAVAGAGAATALAYAGLAWRELAARRFGADWPGALIEDAAACGVAAVAARSLR